MEKKARKASCKKKKRLGCICTICWIIIPIIIVTMLLLDGLGIYPFNTQRLLVIGGCVLVVLLPFFSEITIKNISIKK